MCFFPKEEQVLKLQAGCLKTGSGSYKLDPKPDYLILLL